MAYQSCLYLLLFIGLSLGIWQIFVHYRRTIKIKKWQQQLNLPQHNLVFNQWYQGIDGYMLSKAARAQHDTFDYVYGEIEFIPFIALLTLVPLSQDTVFFDLGSGTGKVVLATAMVFPVKSCFGVEILQSLHETACLQKKKVLAHPEYAQLAENIDFIHGDFLQVNLSSATVVFINSSGFFDPTWSNLCQILDDLPYLKTVITTSKPLKSRVFAVSKTCKVAMSWGVVTAYIHTPQTNIHQTT